MTNELPVFDRALNMWREIDFLAIETSEDELSQYLDGLRAMYGNGSVLHKTFSLPNHPDLMRFISNGSLHSMFFFEKFWQTKSVFAEFPFELRDLNFFNVDLFRWVNPVQLPGSLASALVWGGAYEENALSAREAMKLADAAAEILVAGDFDHTKVFISQDAWSTFFNGVAWDYTWLVIQPDKMRIEVILATDTD